MHPPTRASLLLIARLFIGETNVLYSLCVLFDMLLHDDDQS